MPLVFRERSRVKPEATLALDIAEDERSYLLYHQDGGGNPTEEEVTDAELRAKELEILGRTEPFPPAEPPSPGVAGPGSLNRLMPYCDPARPCLFAESVKVSVDAVELDSAGNESDPDFAVTPVQGHCRFLGHTMAVRYAMRPYPVLPNERMIQQEVQFYETDGTRWRLFYYPEWSRYVRRESKAMDSRVSAQQGSAMHFRAPAQFFAGRQIDGVPFGGIPDMVIPDVALTLTWYAVPARYVEHPDSFLLKYRGRINQSDWNGYAKGSLLYVNVDTIRSYTQLTYTPADAEDVGATQAGSFANELMYDLALHFIRTTRDPGMDYTDEEVLDVVRPHANYVVAGHNLLPHFPSRKFFYATGAPFRGADNTFWVPSYFSVPFEILFQDPFYKAVNLAVVP